MKTYHGLGRGAGAMKLRPPPAPPPPPTPRPKPKQPPQQPNPVVVVVHPPVAKPAPDAPQPKPHPQPATAPAFTIAVPVVAPVAPAVQVATSPAQLPPQPQTPPQPPMPLPPAAQKIVTNATQTLTALKPGEDWTCNSKLEPGACIAKSQRASAEYVKLQQALIEYYQATTGNQTVKITGKIDEQTRLAVKRIIQESSALPYSNLAVTPWLFVAKIRALPRNVQIGVPGLPLPELKKAFPWFWVAAGIAATGAVVAGVAIFR
jgi:hypothetical protein